MNGEPKPERDCLVNPTNNSSVHTPTEKERILQGIKAGSPLAVDPDIYWKFLTQIGTRVKKDAVTSNLVFLTGLSAYTPEPINLFLRGESSTGKSYNAIEVLRYFPREDVWLLGGLSPTALVHSKGMLVDKNGEPILPWEKPKKGADEEEFKAYRERMQGAYYLVDLTGKILVFLEAPNIETFNKLRPILSHDAKEISYRFTDKTGRGQLQAMHVIIRGWPATVFCSTSEKFVQDLSTRSFTVSPETSEEKFKEANELTGTRAAFPWQFETDKVFMELSDYIRAFKVQMEDFRVAVPFGSELAKVFPAKFARSMRDFKHLLGLIQVSALFHYAQRPILVKDGSQRFVLAVREDYDRIIKLWEQIQETTETSAAAHVIRFYHEVVEQVAKDRSLFTVNDLVDTWNAKFPQKRSSDIIRKWVSFLCEIDWMTKEANPENKRENLLKIIKLEKNGKYTQIQLSVFFTVDSLKAWLEQVNQIHAEKPIVLLQNLVTEEETSLEDLYQKHFYCKNDNSAYIDLGSSEASSGESTQEKTDNQKSVHSLNFQVAEILKLERLGPGFEDKCVRCGQSGKMDWQATTHTGEWGLLCGPCGFQVNKQMQESRA